jgi:hypothetical membrane protein
LDEQAQCDKQLKFWQWPNLLGIDASVIAVAWFWMLMPQEENFPILPATILALSIWLTYLADRMLDVRHSNLTQLESLRHRFSFQQRQWLWPTWWGLLSINSILALSSLDQTLLMRGLFLLIATLAYTCAAQKTKPLFPLKELSVGLLFTAGVLIFLNSTPPWPLTLSLFFLFSANCIMITSQENDQASKQGNGIPNWGKKLPPLILLGATLMGVWIFPETLTTLTALVILYFYRKKIPNETYRVITDACLLLTPLFEFISRLTL